MNPFIRCAVPAVPACFLSFVILAGSALGAAAQDTEWWQGERARRQAALDAYLADNADGFRSFKNVPLCRKQGISNFVGVPMVMFRLLPEIFPEIWGKPEEKMLRVGFGPDPWEPDSVMPLGTGYLPSKGITIPIVDKQVSVNYVTPTCAGCHAGAVTGPDGELIRMLGAPTAGVNFLAVLRQTVNDPRFTADTFRQALNAKPVGWVYGDDSMVEQEKLERRLFNLPGGALYFTKELQILSAAITRRIAATLKAYTYSAPDAPPINGVRGMLDPFGAAAASGVDASKMSVEEIEAALPKAPGPADIQATWMQINRAAFQWDNTIERVGYREAAAAYTFSGGDPAAINLDSVILAGKFVEKLPPPPYPFDVDRDKAARGKELFDVTCSGCHRPRNPDVMSPTETGTDPNRAFVITNSALSTLGARIRKACNIPVCFAPDGSELPDAAIMKMTAGYAALPLDGLWATAPYLHNGSVPTLKQLLTGDRPERFYRGNTTYDQEMVGFTWDKATSPYAVVYDTSLLGFSNAGHTGPVFNGDIDWAKEPDKLADLLEYLKTL